MNQITIDHLTAGYDSKVILKNINLIAKPGEILALIGPNGAGKSTLIRVVSGIMKPFEGEVCLNGTNVFDLSDNQRAKRISVVPQAGFMGGAFTVEQTVLLGRTAHMGWLGRASEKDLEFVRIAMEQTNTAELAESRIAEISGGERQRVLLARALAQDTPILLLDEPTNHLDIQHKKNFFDLVCKLIAEKQLCVLAAMHDLNMVSIYARNVVLLKEGEIIAKGTPEEVFTAERIKLTYNTDVDILEHPETKTPLIFPKL